MAELTNYSMGKTLRVYTHTNGIQNSGHKIYSVLSDFNGFPELSEEDFKIMTEVEYKTRMNAFCDYVESLHPGLVVDRSKAYVLTSSITQQNIH